MEIKKVGVVGMSGFMGTGIAQLCAQSGYQVIGSSRSRERINRELFSINSRLARRVDKGSLSQQDLEAIMSRIQGTTDMKDFSGCDLMIETVIEDLDTKKGVFAELDRICPAQAILATNTSCLSLIDIALATDRPDKVLGLHFFPPVPQNKLLEIVRSIATSEETLQAGQKFGESLGKTTVIAKDVPGFIFNRIYMANVLCAIRMLESGIGAAEDIDNCMTLGLNHPIGPLALQDFNGVDICLTVAQAMYEQLKDPAYAPPVLLQKMVAAGWHGRKTGKGFYEYKQDSS